MIGARGIPRNSEKVMIGPSGSRLRIPKDSLGIPRGSLGTPVDPLWDDCYSLLAIISAIEAYARHCNSLKIPGESKEGNNRELREVQGFQKGSSRV